jgi:hypothetical protein
MLNLSIMMTTTMTQSRYKQRIVTVLLHQFLTCTIEICNVFLFLQEDEKRRMLPVEEREHAWVRETYKGDDMAQLSVRAVVTGMRPAARMPYQIS